MTPTDAGILGGLVVALVGAVVALKRVRRWLYGED